MFRVPIAITVYFGKDDLMSKLEELKDLVAQNSAATAALGEGLTEFSGVVTAEIDQIGSKVQGLNDTIALLEQRLADGSLPDISAELEQLKADTTAINSASDRLKSEADRIKAIVPDEATDEDEIVVQPED